MFLPDFDYYAPESMGETVSLLTDLGSSAMILAGGTDLLVKMKHGLHSPEALVSLKNLRELRGIRYEEGRGVVIGALSTMNDIVDSPVLHEHFLSFSEAAHRMAANQVRNLGTIGGNLANAVPSADVPPLLIALDARISLVGQNGERELPLEDFFVDRCCTLIEQNEVITEVTIPDQPTTGSTYHKFGLRRSGALAVVGVATAVTVDDGVIEDCRICLGAVAPTPVRACMAEDILRGQRWSDELLEQAGIKAAQEECCPISDIRGSQEYRRDLVRVFTRRALKRAITEGHV
jgi:aerobic carbon-monoxide dehydrogenase medium subunit